MTPWLTLVIGVILGLILGWLIDLLWRRRPEASPPADDFTALSRNVEGSVPQAAAAGLDTAGARGEDLPTESEMEDALAEDVMATAEWRVPNLELAQGIVEVPAPADTDLPAQGLTKEPIEVAAGAEVERVDWPELSDRVAQVADEVVDEPAHIASVLPETPSGLPAAAIDALAPASGERAGGAASDNLLRIEGIGPVYDGRLREAGIHTFAELVNAGEDRLQEIIHPQAWQRIVFGEWIEQARLIVEGNEEELRLLQGRLFSRKKG